MAIDFELSKKQTKAYLELESKVPTQDGIAINNVLYGGAAGGGKSWFGIGWQIIRRLQYPNTVGMIGRETKVVLKESVVPTFFRIMTFLGKEPGKDYQFNQVALRADFSNGSKIIFKDLEWLPSDPDFQRLGSIEITDLFIEEAQNITEKAFEVASSRIRLLNEHYGLPYSTLLTGNPGPHWLKYRFIKDNEGQPIQLRETDKVVLATLLDNPDEKFRKGYEAKLNTLNEYDRARLLYGDWDAEEKTGGEFYPSYSDTLHTTNEEHYDPSLPLHISFDFNVNPYVTLLVHQVRENQVHLIDEVLGRPPENNTIATCKAFMNIYKGHQGGVIIYGDPSGRQQDTRSERGHNDFTLIQRTLEPMRPSLRITASAPSVYMRGMWINSIFEGKSSITYIVHNKCVEARRDLRNLKKASDGTKNKRKVRNPKTGVSFEEYGHCTDAMEYFLTTCYLEEFSKFAKGGTIIHPSTVIRKKSKRVY